MSIKEKFRLVRRALSSDVLVYQPGKVGSTYVVNVMRELDPNNKVTHLHSFGLDRCYFIKGYDFALPLNFLMALFFGFLVRLSNRSENKKMTVFVPFRDLETRQESVFRGFFEILVGKSVKQSWYKDKYKRDRDGFLEEMRLTFLQSDPYAKWTRNELEPFSGLHLDWRQTESQKWILHETPRFTLIAFDIENFEEVVLHFFGKRLGKVEETNSASAKWCSLLFE